MKVGLLSYRTARVVGSLVFGDACGNNMGDGRRKPTVAAVLDAPSLDRDAVPSIKREAVDEEATSVDRPDGHRARQHSGFGQRGAPRHQSSPGSSSSGTDATPSVPAAHPAQISSVTSASAAVSLASGTGAEVDAASSDVGGMNVIVQPLMRAAPPAVAAAAAAHPVAEQSKDGLTLWNGKWVKNFKRFLKCGTSALEQLPRIIGGGDLVGAAALKRARLNDDAEYACPLQPLGETRRGSCDDDDWSDNGNVGGRDDDDVHVAASARSRSSSSRPSTAAARAFVVDDDDSMGDSSQQSRIDAIFDRVAGRRAKF